MNSKLSRGKCPVGNPSSVQTSCDPTYHTWVCHVEQSSSIPNTFLLLDEAKPEKAALSPRSCEWCPDHPVLPQNQADNGQKNKPIYGYFGSPHQKSGSKAPTVPSLSLHRLMHFGSEHLVPAGTFRKAPEPAAAAFPASSVQCVFKPWLETY